MFLVYIEPHTYNGKRHLLARNAIFYQYACKFLVAVEDIVGIFYFGVYTSVGKKLMYGNRYNFGQEKLSVEWEVLCV